jgi:hypothetical protein
LSRVLGRRARTVLRGPRRSNALGLPDQAVRMVKSKTRVSGGFRTLTGAQTFLAIRGYISTIRKNGLRAATELRHALLGNPWMPPTVA